MSDNDDGKRFPATRREAIGAIAMGAAVPSLLGWPDEGTPAPRRPRIAAVVTEYRKGSHGQGIIDRFLDGYGWQGRHYVPGIDIVSLYVDQKPKGDLTAERVARHPQLTLAPTIDHALTLGGQGLAVDGVVLIGEHGSYPRNAKGQTLYPRYEFFQQVVDVFRRVGRTVPVFNDKHLSWSWDLAKKMVDASRELGFPFLAGSSLPVTWRIPGLETPRDAVIQDAVCVGYGGVDSYDFHGLESLQCLVERRRGGEQGVTAVEVLRGDEVWKFLDDRQDSSAARTRKLFNICLCRSFTLRSPRKGYSHVFPEVSEMATLARRPLLYRLFYRDGLVGSLFMMSGLVQDFTVALQVENEPRILSTQMNLPGLATGQTLPNFFSPLCHHIEAMFLTGKAPYPVERTLLTTGVLAAAVDLIAEKRPRMETPHLSEIAYQAPTESQFMRS